MSVHFVTYGVAQQQGSKTAFARMNNSGKPVAIMKDANETKLSPWRAAVATAARDWQQEHQMPLFDEAVEVVLDFVFAPPKSAKSDFKTTAPDWDKLARSVCDSMTGIIYADDRLIAHAEVWKRYDASVPPHVSVWVRPLRWLENQGRGAADGE